MEIDVAAIVEKIMEELEPGTIVIARFPEMPETEDDAEEMDEPEADDNLLEEILETVYDDFQYDLVTGTSGGGAMIDAILMDNPLQT